MHSLQKESQGPLPLVRKGVLETPLDWMGLWDAWSMEGPAIFLESGGPVTDASQWMILAGAPESEFYEDQGQGKLTSFDLDPVHLSFETWLNTVARFEAPFRPLPDCLSTAWFGAVSYEWGRSNAIGSHPSLSSDARVPGFYFFKPSGVLAVHRGSREYFFFSRSSNDPFAAPGKRLADFRIGSFRAQVGEDEYGSMVRRAQAYIAHGDIYQANIAQSFQARWQGSAGNLYRLLRELNPGPFMGVLQAPGFSIVSSSPERLIEGKGDHLEMRPIAGTRPRATDKTQDLQLRNELETNPKERAEHLMLVDLARNDLGRVCRYGTVEVERFAEVEAYSRVQHLVSTVRGSRMGTSSLLDILRSVFPGGTITGCPKIRCMEIIQELEGRPRGFYTGSMGYLGPGPCFDLNILIRSFTLSSDGRLEFHAGAGIVADSDPHQEYLETLYKVEALAQALGTSLVTSP